MSQLERDIHYIKMAMDMAEKAEEKGEVPVGAILVKDDEVISTGFNFCIGSHDPSA